jgi:hypothetical protein
MFEAMTPATQPPPEAGALTGRPAGESAGWLWWSVGEQKCLLATVALFFLFRVFDAPMRYFLLKVGATALTALPNLLTAALLLLYLVKMMFALSAERGALLAGVLFCYATVVGYIEIGNVLQIAIGVYGLLPIFLGLLAHGAFVENFGRMKTFFIACWVACVAGIFLATVVSFPWVGLSYQNLGVEVEGTREWSTFGITRIAGFSRSSFEAAITVLFFMMVQMALLRRTWTKFLVCTVSGVAIAVTTSKTIVAIHLLLVFFLLTRSWRRCWSAVVLVITAVMVAFPISAAFFQYNLDISDLLVKVLLLSFEDRLVNTWPQAWKLLDERGSLLLGRGVGGIGGGQQFFEKAIFNPADNLFVYLYLTFGVFSLLLLYLFLKRMLELLRAQDDGLNRFFLLVSLTVLTFGITANVLESPLPGFLMGVFFMYRQGVPGAWRKYAP